MCGRLIDSRRKSFNPLFLLSRRGIYRYRDYPNLVKNKYILIKFFHLSSFAIHHKSIYQPKICFSSTYFLFIFFLCLDMYTDLKFSLFAEVLMWFTSCWNTKIIAACEHKCFRKTQCKFQWAVDNPSKPSGTSWCWFNVCPHYRIWIFVSLSATRVFCYSLINKHDAIHFCQRKNLIEENFNPCKKRKHKCLISCGKSLSSFSLKKALENPGLTRVSAQRDWICFASHDVGGLN